MNRANIKLTPSEIVDLILKLDEDYKEGEIRDFVCEELEIDYCPDCGRYVDKEDITEAGDCGDCAKAFAAEQSYFDWYFNGGR